VANLTRRGFFGTLSAAAIGLTLAAKLPGIASAPPRLAEREGTTLAASGGPFYVGMTLKIGDEFAIVKGWTRETNTITLERGHA